MSFKLFVVIICTFIIYVHGFSSVNAVTKIRRNGIKMEYIPDGLTKQQWEELKKREIAEMKAKGNLGVMGVQRFKSRSLQAWQEAGAKHLFPVNPNEVPYEARPYMQRRGGDWEGSDLKKKNLEGKKQGEASKRLDTDNRYDKYEKDGLLNSVNIFGRGPPLPWTAESAAAMSKSDFNPTGKQGARATTGKQLSPEEIAKLKAQLVKPIISKSAESVKAEAPKPAPKKFGFF